MRKGLNMTRADAEAHAKKHGYQLSPTSQRTDLETAVAFNQEFTKYLVPKKGRQNKTELSFGLILEAQKQRGEIVEYRYQGIRLPWGEDPNTGALMHYKPDFYVVEWAEKLLLGKALSPERGIFWKVAIKLIEVKGAHIFSRDLVRFRGCRAEWPMFHFELWQKKAGQWNRLE
jgi:hypothetical protein